MAFNELSPYNTDELEARLSTTFARRVDVQPVSARGAVTISWDDGWLEWYTNLLPMLRDEFPHQNHTFAYTPGLLDNPNGLYQTTAQAQELAAALPHCEIASHSQTHANMKNSTVPVRVAEYDDSRPTSKRFSAYQSPRLSTRSAASGRTTARTVNSTGGMTGW